MPTSSKSSIALFAASQSQALRHSQLVRLARSNDVRDAADCLDAIDWSFRNNQLVLCLDLYNIMKHIHGSSALSVLRFLLTVCSSVVAPLPRQVLVTVARLCVRNGDVQGCHACTARHCLGS